MDAVFHLVCLVEGVAVPVLEYQASWDVQNVAGFSVSLPKTAFSRKIQASTHVHLFLARGLEYRLKRNTQRTKSKKDNLPALWVDGHVDSIGDVERVKLSFPETAWNILDLKDGLLNEGVIYRTGGEVVSVSETDTTSGNRVIVLQVQQYSHLLEKANVRQLLGSRAPLNKKEIRHIGQEEELYKGSGKRAFYRGFMAELDKEGKDLPQVLQNLIYRYGRVTNPMWRNRFSFARISNQIASIPDDEVIKKVTGTKGFRDYVKAILESQQEFPLFQLVQAMLEIQQHTMISVPSPAYFPIAPGPDQDTTYTKTTTLRRGDLGIEVSVLINSGGAARPDGIRARDYDYAILDASTGRFRLGTKAIEQKEENIPAMLEVPGYSVHHKPQATAVEAKINSDGSVSIRCKVPEDATGGPGTYNIRIAKNDLPWSSHATSKNIKVAQFPLKMQNQGQHYKKLVKDKIIVNAPGGGKKFKKVKPNVALKDTVTLLVRIEVTTGPSIKKKETITKKAEPDGPELPNTLSRLNTNLMVPSMWWAMFPMCNVVTPDLIIESITSQITSMMEPTRLIVKVPQGRSGWRKSYTDTFPTPTEGALQSDWSDDISVTRPDKLHPHEYVSGPQPTILEVAMLYRYMKDREWKQYIQAFADVEFWNRRLSERVMQFQMQYDPSIVVGAPLLLITDLGDSKIASLTPEQKHLIERLRALTALRKSLRKCIRGVPKNILRHLICLHNYLAFMENHEKGAEDKKALDASGEPYNAAKIMNQIKYARNRYLDENKAMEDLEEAAPWGAKMGMMKYRDEYPYNAQMVYWNMTRATASLGLQAAAFQEHNQMVMEANREVDEQSAARDQAIRDRVTGVYADTTSGKYYESQVPSKVYREGGLMDAATTAAQDMFLTGRRTQAIGAREQTIKTLQEESRAQFDANRQGGIDYSKIFTGQTTFRATKQEILTLISAVKSGRAGVDSILACNSALRSDIKKIDDAIAETKALLRKYGNEPEEAAAYIGYVVQVTDEWSAEGNAATMSVTLTHVRSVGEDLFKDDLAGDDVENAVSFGEKGLFSEKYRRDKIGPEVYKPLYGTTTAFQHEEIMEVRKEIDAEVEAELEEGALEGLPPIDAQDVIDTFKHPRVCGHNCADHSAGKPGERDYTESEMAEAVMRWLSSLKKEQDEEYMAGELQKLKTRTWMDIAEAYSGITVMWGREETEPELVGDFKEDLSERYEGDEPPIEGFWSTSFLGVDTSDTMKKRITPRKVDVDKKEPTLAEEEIALLEDRAVPPQEMIKELSDKTF